MKITKQIIFAIVLIVLCLLSCVELKKNQNKRSHTKREYARTIESIANQIAGQFNQQNKIDLFAWKKDRFLRPLKNEIKYKTTANTSNKWTLFKFLVGKFFATLGLDVTTTYNWVTKLRQPELLKIIVILMRFQQSMNFDDLRPLLDLRNKPPGLNAGTLLPTFRSKVLSLLDRHIRKRPMWY